MAPVSSSTRFLSAQAQSSVEYSARVHKATLLESAMSLTNGQLRPPRSCGRASVAWSTMGRCLLLITCFSFPSLLQSNSLANDAMIQSASYKTYTPFFEAIARYFSPLSLFRDHIVDTLSVDTLTEAHKSGCEKNTT